jgi:hypothetical protein
MFTLNQEKGIAMFISTDKKVPTYNVGQTIQRRQVSTGHVFRYTPSSGEGYLYAHLDIYQGAYYSLKFSKNAKENTTSVPMNYTSTPAGSDRVTSNVEIVGHFQFNVDLDQTPLLSVIGGATDGRTVVSLRDDVDEKGYPHLYLVLGRTHTSSSDASKILLIQLTKTSGSTSHDWSAFRTFPLDTMVALRGNADVTIYEGGE